MESGRFVISLDFELLWGLQDHATAKTYGENILGGREAKAGILGLFKKYQIHATWGVVGFMFAKSKKELMEYAPEQLPSYKRRRLSNYLYFDCVGVSEEEDP